jgi:hypothetical protein
MSITRSQTRLCPTEEYSASDRLRNHLIHCLTLCRMRSWHPEATSPHWGGTGRHWPVMPVIRQQSVRQSLYRPICRDLDFPEARFRCTTHRGFSAISGMRTRCTFHHSVLSPTCEFIGRCVKFLLMRLHAEKVTFAFVGRRDAGICIHRTHGAERVTGSSCGNW